ncbi:hypothetical protein [Paracoccus sp. ME4]|uniref:hypothetical protein n=1 Tax=Paracoccus sp. ME4 TaxID=3138066 RepID=UPI00398B7BB8
MSRADLIPLSLLRDLAARIPDPIRPATFVDLAVFSLRGEAAVQRVAAPAAPPAEAPAAVADPAPAPKPKAAASAPKCKRVPKPQREAKPARAATPTSPAKRRGEVWTIKELEKARGLINGGMSQIEAAQALGRPVPAARFAFRRYGVLGDGPITPPRAEADYRAPKATKAAPVRPATEPAPQPAAPKATAPAPVSAPIEPARPAEASQEAIVPVGALSKKARAMAVLKAALAEKLPGRQIRILDHLLKLPRETFSAADDLFLAEGIISRRALPEIADQLGCEAPEVTARWKAMMFPDLTDRHGHILLDGQTELLRALRWMDQREAQICA